MGDKNKLSCDTGLIFNIQRFSVHDGPGIRDLVFMKGCPLRCRWCDNPESQKASPELAFNEDRCIGCGWCQEVCPTGAITVLDEGKVRVDRKICNDCAKCVDVCPAKALKLFGDYVSVGDILKVIEKDGAFHLRSGGGITVGGGEPIMQADFVHELLKDSRKRGIDTAMETSGYGDWESLEKVCRYANLVFYDIKHMDSNKHKTYTRVPNELILENIDKLSTYHPEIPIIARIPIVPGFNDSEENIETTVDFLTRLKGVRECELLPYHGFGEPKYHQLARKYPLSGCQPPSKEQMKVLRRITQRLAVR